MMVCFIVDVLFEGRSFKSNFENFKILSRLEPKNPPLDMKVCRYDFEEQSENNLDLKISPTPSNFHLRSFLFQNRYNFAVLHIGTPVCGMNACLFSFVRNCLHRGGRVFGIFNGIEGFLVGNVSFQYSSSLAVLTVKAGILKLEKFPLSVQFQEIQWSDVTGLVSEGGSYLGTKRTIPTEEMFPKFAEQFNNFKIHGFLIIGSFEVSNTLLSFFYFDVQMF